MARKGRKSARRASGGSSARKSTGSIRSLILSVFSREKKVYDRSTKEYVRQPLTMAEVAQKIGVSVRTLRRWKNEGTQPQTKTRTQKTRVERLQKAARKAEKQTSGEVRRDLKKHPGRLRITRRDLPVMPVGHRRKLKQYARDKKGRMRATGAEYDSSIVNYNVRGWSFREIAALVLQAWHARRAFQFVYEVPAGGNLPESGRSKERRVRELTRMGTAPVDPYGFDTEAEVLTFLNRYIDIENAEHSRRMVYVAIDDKPIRQSYADDEDEE